MGFPPSESHRPGVNRASEGSRRRDYVWQLPWLAEPGERCEHPGLGQEEAAAHTWILTQYISVGKACNAGDLGSILGLGRSRGEGDGSPLQYSCLENPMGRGAWWTMVHGVTRVGHDSATKPPPPPPSHPQLGIFPTKEGNCSRQHGRPHRGSNFPTRP